MQDAWRAYLELALGVTEASRKKAQKVAQRLIGKGGATASQLQTFTEELLSAGTTNREALIKLVRAEVERTLGKVGLASAEEVAGLTKRVQELEAELRDARARSATAEAGAPVATSAGSTGQPAVELPGAGETTVEAPPAAGAPTAAKVAKKTTARKAVVKKAPAVKASATAARKVAPAKAAGKATPPETGQKKAAAAKSTKSTGGAAKRTAKAAGGTSTSGAAEAR